MPEQPSQLMAEDQPTIADLCAAYLKDWKRRYEVEKVITWSTYYKKRDQIVRHIEPYYGGLHADELTQDYVDGYPAWREARRLNLAKLSRKKPTGRRFNTENSIMKRVNTTSSTNSFHAGCPS